MSHAHDDFAGFVLARGDSLRRFAFLLCGDRDAAEDLVQSALVKLMPRWERISREGSADAYARAVIVNLRRSFWRRRSSWELPVAGCPEQGSQVSDPSARVAEADRLGRALAQLSERQRAAVVLRFYEDLSELDTAAVLGCSVGTVKSQTHRALRALRVLLKTEAEDARH